MLNMQVKSGELEKITQIMLRAASLMNFDNLHVDRLHVCMDLTACHVNGCALDLDGLLEADSGDFCHDVAGIVFNINRRTGQLENCFVPRYAKVNAGGAL